MKRLLGEKVHSFGFLTQPLIDLFNMKKFPQLQCNSIVASCNFLVAVNVFYPVTMPYSNVEVGSRYAGQVVGGLE